MTSQENTLPNDLAEADTPKETHPENDSSTNNSMDEFYALRQELLLSTLIISAVVFFSVWWFYALDVALSYALGTSVGMVYLRMLARDVERLGPEKKLGKNRLALFVVLILVAARWNQTQIVPAFLGFLTFKAAIIFYTLRITLPR